MRKASNCFDDLIIFFVYLFFYFQVTRRKARSGDSNCVSIVPEDFEIDA